MPYFRYIRKYFIKFLKDLKSENPLMGPFDPIGHREALQRPETQQVDSLKHVCYPLTHTQHRDGRGGKPAEEE
jgi:hypothetical protein